MMWGLRDVGFRSFEGSTGLALNVPGSSVSGGPFNELLARRTLGRGVARKSLQA